MMAAIPSLGDRPTDRPGDPPLPIEMELEGDRQLPPPPPSFVDNVLGQYMEVDISLAEEEECWLWVVLKMLAEGDEECWCVLLKKLQVTQLWVPQLSASSKPF